MLQDNGSLIAKIIRKNRGISRHHRRGIVIKPQDFEQPSWIDKEPPNIGLITPLILNSNALGVGGVHASIAITLSHLLIINSGEPKTQKEIAKSIGIGGSTLDRHLVKLRQLNLIEIEKVIDPSRGFIQNTYHFEGLKNKLKELGVEV